jgi:antirestriction protein ArdC
MLCALADISPATIEASAAYIDHWLGALRGDKRLVVSASAHAQRAADYITGDHDAPAAASDVPLALAE